MSGAVTESSQYPVSNARLSDKIYGSGGGTLDDADTGRSFSAHPRPQDKDIPFLIFQYRGRDVLAVPKGSRAACLEGVKKYQPFSQKRQLYRMLISALIRFGAWRLVAITRAGPVNKDYGFDFKIWRRELERNLGRSIAHAIVTWPSESSRWRLYVHLLDAELRAFAFVKLAFSSGDNLVLEAEALRTLNELEFQKVRVPKLMSHGRIGDVSYLVMESLPAHVKPLRLTQDWDSSVIVAEYCGQRRRLSGAEIMNLRWWSAYAKALRSEHRSFHAELIRLLALGTEVCRAHGDLGLANMVTDGQSTWIFDWESSDFSAPALADSIGFFMSFALGKSHRNPRAHLARFQARFLSDNSEEQRVAVMLAVAFRHGYGIPDAGRIMKAWTARSEP
jgi:hypothetical protein